MPVTVEDAMKAVLPLIAGVVSSYSAPAARGIQGATGAFMALDERKRRDAEAEQERQLRADEGARRNKILDMQATEMADAKAQAQKNAQDAGALFGSVLSQYGGPATAPIEGTGGVMGGEGISEEDARQNADVATAARIGQVGAANPAIVQAALGHIMSAPGVAAALGQRWQEFQAGQTQHAADRAQDAKDRAADRAIRKQEADQTHEYQTGVLADRKAESDARKADATSKQGDKSTEELGKKNKRIADLNDLAATRNLLPGELAELKRLQIEVAGLAGTNTGAGYLDNKLGLGRGAQ